eukprot:m.215511 g.215511  ORF g.215511 m.215511 type:complete len:169 (+) comp39833_c3_seq39:2498-3004(+)
MFGDCLEDVAKKLPAHEENHTTSAPSHSRNMHSFNGTQNSKTQVSNPTPVALEQVKAESESGDEIARIAEIVRKKCRERKHESMAGCEVTKEIVHVICQNLNPSRCDILRKHIDVKEAMLPLKAGTSYQEGSNVIDAWVGKRGRGATLEILLKGCSKAGILGIIDSHL